MISETYKNMVNMIRVRRELIDHEIESRYFENYIGPTELMCATWYIRGQIEKIYHDLYEIYWNDETDLTGREYKALNSYIYKLEDYYWNLLYDKGMIITKMFLERR